MATQITEILADLNVSFRLAGEHRHASSRFAQIDCPFCGESDGYHLGWHLSGRFANCWRCGPHSPVTVLRELTNKPLEWCKKRLAGLGTYARTEERPNGKLILPGGLGPMKETHKRYLMGRGLDPETCERVWGFQGIGLAAKLSWRIFIPIQHHGRTVSWTTRAVGPNAQRYISASHEQESLSHKRILFGSDLARHSIVICEGPLDAVRIGPGAVATCGIGFSQGQVLEASKRLQRVICFDAEPAAQKRAKDLMDCLSVFDGRTVNVVLDTGKDPGDASEKEIRQLRRRFLT